jgi:hypothetical protein
MILRDDFFWFAANFVVLHRDMFFLLFLLRFGTIAIAHLSFAF